MSSGGSCGFPFCERKQKIQEYCPRHQKNLLTYFCANQTCLQVLCSECLKSHQESHKNLALSPEKICNLIELEEYYQRVTDKQLEYQTSSKEKGLQKVTEPCQILCQYVDEYFYGSPANKLQNLRARKDQLIAPNTKSFIDIVEKTSHYKISPNFKQRYFSLLDELLAGTMP